MPKGIHKHHLRSEQHPRWNDGTKKSSHGYIKIRVGLDHPLADPNGYAYEHLLVWRAAGNPMPGRDEVIHHRNENKTDNRIGNLELKRRIDHSVQHNNGLKDSEVLSMRHEYARGELDMPRLAEKYGVPVARVSRIIRGETRRSAGGPVSTLNRGKNAAGRSLDGREWNEFPRTGERDVVPGV